MDKIAKDVEAGRYRKAETALHQETTSGRLARATFEKRNDARAIYNDLTRMQEPQKAEDFGGRVVVKSGSGWAVRGNEEDRKALGGAYLYTTKTKADAEDWARTHTAAQRAMREGRPEEAVRLNQERKAALTGGEGRAYRPQGSVAMVPAEAAKQRAAEFQAPATPEAPGGITDPLDQAMIREAIAERGGGYYGGPMGLSKGDAARYLTEGHLKALTDKYGYDNVRDAVRAEIDRNPSALDLKPGSPEWKAAQAARLEASQAASKQAMAALKAGQHDEAARIIREAQLAHPSYREQGHSFDEMLEFIGKEKAKALPEPSRTNTGPKADNAHGGNVGRTPSGTVAEVFGPSGRSDALARETAPRTAQTSRLAAVREQGARFSGNPEMILPKYENLTSADWAALTPDERDNAQFVMAKLAKREGTVGERGQALQGRFGVWGQATPETAPRTGRSPSGVHATGTDSAAQVTAAIEALRNANGDRTDARLALSGLTGAQVREVARQLNVRRDNAGKNDLIDRIAQRHVDQHRMATNMQDWAKRTHEHLDEVGRKIDTMKEVRGQRGERTTAPESDLAIAGQIHKLAYHVPDVEGSRAAQQAARADAEAEVRQRLGSFALQSSTIKAKMAAAAGDKALAQHHLEETRRDLAEAQRLRDTIGDPELRAKVDAESVRPIQRQIDEYESRVATADRKLADARVDLDTEERIGGDRLKSRLASERRDEVSRMLISGGYGDHGTGKAGDENRRYFQAQVFKAAGKRAMSGIDQKKLTPEQIRAFNAEGAPHSKLIVDTLDARERRELALSRLAQLDTPANRARADADPVFKAAWEDAVRNERAGLAAAETELTGLEPKFNESIDALDKIVNGIRASQGLRAASINRKTLETQYRKRLTERGIAPQAPFEVRTGRTTAGGRVAAPKPQRLTEAQAQEGFRAIERQANGPVAPPERVAVGAPGSGFTEPPRAGGITPTAGQIERANEVARIENARYQTFSQRMAGDMSEADRQAARIASDERAAQLRAQEAERARQMAEAAANDTRTEREKLTEQLQTHRDVQRVNMQSGRSDPKRAARIKVIEDRLAVLDTEDRKAKIKELGVKKGDTVNVPRFGELEVVGTTKDGYLRVLRPDGRRGSVDPKTVEGVTKAGKYAKLSDEQIRNALEMRGSTDAELVAEAKRRGIPINPATEAGRVIGGQDTLIRSLGEPEKDAHGAMLVPGDEITIASRLHNREGERAHVIATGTGKASGVQLAEVRYANGDIEQVMTGNIVRTTPAGKRYLDNLRAELGSQAPAALAEISGERPRDVAVLQAEARKRGNAAIKGRLEQAAHDLEVIRRGNASSDMIIALDRGAPGKAKPRRSLSG